MITTRDAGSEFVIRSFRDPAGTVLRHNQRILRTVNPEATADLEAFLATRLAREAMESGALVRSARIPPDELPDLAFKTGYVLEHERIPFPSYPYEWPPEMLHAAGKLTIQLARRGLQEGFDLKDATPYNVLFRGVQPVFVDVLSFERRGPLACTWMAYAQFVRTFLLPLLANRTFGLPLGDILSGHRDGLEPETMYRWAGFWRRLTPQFLRVVTLPTWLGRRRGDGVSLYQPRNAASHEQANFILNGILKSCCRRLAAVEPGARRGDSTWSAYHRKSIYTHEQLERKEAFVSDALEMAKPRTVLDIGANEGHFSFVAAKHGASVVAIDSDPVVAGSIWRHASRAGLDVLPLVVDITRPTPALGWRNRECESFLDRARGGFHMVMMLAVAHHMLVTERIPLDDLLDLAGELSREYVLLEFVAPEDPMFQRIVRGRERLYSHLTNTRFEASARSRFDLVRSLRIDGLHRWLYLFRQRRATN